MNASPEADDSRGSGSRDDRGHVSVDVRSHGGGKTVSAELRPA
ncbi:hypothetical protein [Streptomyces sp. H27-H5]|nr:hypothetical protein [Streptomyces sp. H27-H5]MCY0961364.1 hypothetical protein [Streptomyces sp. H27-H5]